MMVCALKERLKGRRGFLPFPTHSLCMVYVVLLVSSVRVDYTTHTHRQRQIDIHKESVSRLLCNDVKEVSYLFFSPPSLSPLFFMHLLSLSRISSPQIKWNERCMKGKVEWESQEAYESSRVSHGQSNQTMYSNHFSLQS